MSQKETREQLLAALTECIEQAPDKASEPLLRAYKAFVEARGEHGMRQLGRTPLTAMLLEAIEDGESGSHSKRVVIPRSESRGAPKTNRSS
jgi:hypothetical protein